MNKGENIVKWIKGKGLVDSVTWGEWRRIGCPKRSSPKNWKGQDVGEDPGKGRKRK
jgi:hypothetical protein